MPADSGARRIIGHQQFGELFCIAPRELTDTRPQRQKEIRDFRAGRDAPRLVFVAATKMSGTPFRDNTVHLDLRKRKLLDPPHKRSFLLSGDKFRPVNKPFRQIAGE